MKAAARGKLAVVQPFYGGTWHETTAHTIVDNKYDGSPVSAVGEVDRQQVTEAIGAVVAAQDSIRWDPRSRSEVLYEASRLMAQRRDAFIDTVVVDSGFTRKDAAREVERAAETLLVTAEEAKRLVGEVVPLDGAPGPGGRLGFTVHRPLGVVCAITPFNSPLNTVLHKLAPALAAGNGVVLKPAHQTPLTADRLLQLLLDAGVPPALIAVLYGEGATVGRWMVEDPRPAFYAFTGSTAVGAKIRQGAGLRRVQLEMGSLSSTIVCADADLAMVAAQVVGAAFRKAGQVCTSVQRLYVARPVVEELTALLVSAVAGLAAGDPASADTFVGPVVAPGEANRIESWIAQAVSGGGEVVVGGGRDGNVIHPTVLTGIGQEMSLMCSEVFGPVVVLRPFDDIDTAIDEANDTPYGLAAGVYTRDLNLALRLGAELRMGSVHINQTSSNRVDLMPYTGVKLSGLGREGPRYAMREMSEERLITFGAG